MLKLIIDRKIQYYEAVQKPEDIVATFFDSYKTHQYVAGSVIVNNHETPEHVFFVRAGKVRMYDISSTGNKLTLNILAKGAFFSLAWVYGHENRFYFEAIEKCELTFCPLEDVRQFILRHPDVAVGIISRLSSGFDGLFLRLSASMGGTAEQRIIIEILIEAWRTHKNEYGVPLQLNINNLAINTGLARETVSRKLSELVRKKLLLKKNKYYVRDIKALENYFFVT